MVKQMRRILTLLSLNYAVQLHDFTVKEVSNACKSMIFQLTKWHICCYNDVDDEGK